jgi:hypothetical protein
MLKWPQLFVATLLGIVVKLERVKLHTYIAAKSVGLGDELKN